MKIEEMENWEILEYLRSERNWFVISGYNREDIKDFFDISFKTNEEWNDFTDSLCSSWSNSLQSDTIQSLVENYKHDQ